MKDCPIVARNSSSVIGVLSGWDRLVFRGCIPMLSYLDAMLLFLRHLGILLKDYSEWALRLSDELKQACLDEAIRLNRPIKYLPSSGARKDELARQILRDSPVAEGLVCTFTCLEPCRTFRVRGNRQNHRLELRTEQTKCLHVYKYWLDSQFGFMGARLQTWLPCEVQIWINGREWLARRMDRKAIAYRRHDNCFPWIEDFPAAQRMFNQMQRTHWIRSLNRILSRLCPTYTKRLDGNAPYWTAFQTEWATDVCFDSPDTLRNLYRPLVRGAMTALGCDDVLRFLKKRADFGGEVDSNFRRREEGVRVKHYAGGNSVKAYDKAETVLRVETTINQPGQFRVYRTKQGDEDGGKAWRPLRKSVVDLHRRADVSQQVNDRYEEALASLDTTQELIDLVTPICRSIRRDGLRYRGLRPWSEEDRRLLEAVSRAEHVVAGFTNRDIASHLYPGEHDDKRERGQIASRVSYRIRLLRRHGLIRKVKNQRRYQITTQGRQILTAILAAQHATVQQLNALAA
jgi:DNA-binding PadR family transcriptional regulator